MLIARDYLDDDFVMYLGDSFIVGGIADLIDRPPISCSPAATIAGSSASWKSMPRAARRPGGEAARAQERPGAGRGLPVHRGGARGGGALQAVLAGRAGDHRRHPGLIDTGQTVNSTVISGYWKDTGNVTDMLEVNRLVLESVDPRVDGDVDEVTELIGRVVVEWGVLVRGSRIVGPAITGPGVHVTRSCVGPFTSIGAECVVSQSEVEDSIVLSRGPDPRRPQD